MDDKKQPLHKQAKLEALKELRNMAMQMIKDSAEEGELPAEMGKMQKVMVAAKDKEGLKEGLEKAEDILEGSEEEESDEEMDKAPESMEDEEAMLMAKLEALRAKKAQKA